MGETGARSIVLAARPEGRPKDSAFGLDRIPVPTPGPDQLLLRTQCLSLDPYKRLRMDDGNPMPRRPPSVMLSRPVGEK